MGQEYVEALREALAGVRDVAVQVAMPFAILVGLLAVSLAVLNSRNPESATANRDGIRKLALRIGSYGLISLLVIGLWAALGKVRPLAQQDIEWRESAEATTNATPDAPPTYQYGPAAAALVEHTYTRSLTLPPDFMQRIGAEGVSVLSPYLTDPAAENVMSLQDKFSHSGKDVVFTRESTQLEEQPIAFDSSKIRADFKSLSGTAYDADFHGEFQFTNTSSEPIKGRFSFPLPEGGTIRDLRITVGGQPVAQASDSDAYLWEGPIAAGEKKTGIVHYRLVGARQWSYDMGSRRRRVQRFRLDVNTESPIRFMRGSIQPTSRLGSQLAWDMSEVITQQRIGLQFPKKTAAKEAFLQSLAMLPGSLILFLISIGLFGFKFRAWPPPGTIAAALALFAVGLGSSLILAGYFGPVVGVVAGPLLGAALASLFLGGRWLPAGLVAALLPAPFLSPENSGALALFLVLAAVLAWRLAPEKTRDATQKN